MEVGPPQGSMGQMSSTSGGYMYDNSNSTGFEDEPPLLEELGIDFHLIKENVIKRESHLIYHHFVSHLYRLFLC
jgi:hypothetical protein